MADLITLSESDVKTLKEYIDRVRRINQNPPLRPYVEPEYTPSSEVLIALAPDSGIPPISGYLPGGGIECPTFKYREGDVSSVLEDTGVFKVVYNLFDTEVPANTWILIIKDKHGVWWVSSRFFTVTTEDDGLLDVGTGTGTSTGTVGTGTSTADSTTGTATGTVTTCDDITIIETDIVCSEGYLQVWNRTITLNIVSGCLTKQAGEWEYVRDEGCCDCVDVGTATATSTAGTATSTSTAGTSTAGTGSAYYVSTTCCGVEIPSILFATLTVVGTGSVENGTYPLVWNGSMWEYTEGINGLTITLSCSMFDFGASVLIDGQLGSDLVDTVSCGPPFLVTWSAPIAGQGTASLTISS